MTEYRAAELQAPPQIDRLQRTALIVGVIGLALAAFGWVVNPQQFLKSYLLAFVYVVAIPLGSLALMMIHHLSGGGWGMPTRRIFEASARTLPFMAVLFLPVALGLHQIFEWTHTEVVLADPILRQKMPYLNVPFFLVRTALYFAVWSGLAYLLSGWSRAQDAGYVTGSERKFRLVSGPGILLYAVCATFASVDWIMSLDPHWFSTIFGLLFMIQHGLATLAFTILMLSLLSRTEPMSKVIKPINVHDVSKLMLAFVMIWAYFNFSQFLIIWSANLPEEIPWYIARLSHGWEWVSLFVLVGQFFLPFFLLLSRDLKRHASRVAYVAAFVLVMRYVDFYWNLMPTPSMDRETPMIHWIDLATVVGLSGLWLWLFAWQYRGRPLLPVGDPYLQEALSSHGAH
jgi:hypothetical protein